MKFSLSAFKIPHVFIFLSGIILFSAILTYIIPSGSYDRSIKKVGHMEQTMVVPGSYKELPKHFSLKGFILGEDIEGMASPTSVLELFSSIPKGMNQAASLIFFVLIIGAVFNIIQESGTINVIMFRLMARFREKPFILFFAIYFALSCASSFMGMGSEFIPLIPIFLLIAKETGRDRLFGVSLYMLPVFIGWTTAITNPFTVQIAQSIAELPIGSGMPFRIILFVICFIIGFAYLIRYGNKVKKNWSNSIMNEDHFELDGSFVLKNEPVTRRHILIVVTAATLFALILYAVQTMGWGLIEMTGGFFMVGLSTIVIAGMSNEKAMSAFVKGLEMMIVPALIVGFARAIQVVMIEGEIVDTILFQTAALLETMPKAIAVEGMFVFQSGLNFFIPSASGQALVTMPLMVPLADLIDVSRQTSVLAFILGDGFSNMIIPTNGVMMAILGIAFVPFEKWFKFVLPLFLIFLVISFIALYVAINIGY
jgi:uncharacterized ion transporter superfamily protein YfcC